jgi:hypothetical protein
VVSLYQDKFHEELNTVFGNDPLKRWSCSSGEQRAAGDESARVEGRGGSLLTLRIPRMVVP